jgi:hypothetical protein
MKERKSACLSVWRTVDRVGREYICAQLSIVTSSIGAAGDGVGKAGEYEEGKEEEDDDEEEEEGKDDAEEDDVMGQIKEDSRNDELLYDPDA